MMRPIAGKPDIRLPPGTRSSAGLLAVLVLLTACKASVVDTDPEATYRITAGACGDVVFAESLGVDSASAVTAIELRTAEKHGAGKVTVQLHRLEVVDEHGNPPQPNFYAVHIVDSGSGMLAHSVYEVVTNAGDLFHLRWCPD